ncbi:MAG: hypothetical protein ABI234_09810 [Ktedonobacteraceae bacterium]
MQKSSMALDFSVEDDEAPQKRGNIFQRMARAWLRFSGPNLDRFDSSLKSQELLRRSRIMSVLNLLIIVAVVIISPTILPAPNLLAPILALILCGFASFLCNRTGFVTASTVIYIFGIDAAIVISLVTLPHGLRNTNIPDLDLFLVATLAGGIVLPRRLLPFLALFHIALIILLFTFVPHEQLLIRESIESGQGFYGEISDAILLQIVGTSIAWLNAWSVDRALVRASKAEDLAKAHQRLNEYTQLQAAQRENLEHGIQVLKDAHARFANGDYKARAVLQDNELVSLALSFNLLAERLNRIALIARDYSRLEQALQQLFAVRDAIIHQGTLHPFNPTGTYADQLYPWVKQFYQSRRLSAQYGETVEKVRLTLLRQRTLVTQLKSSLDQTHINAQTLGKETRILSSAIEGVEKAQQLCLQVEEQGKRCLQETQQFEQLLKASN